MGWKHSEKPHVGDCEGTPGFPGAPGWAALRLRLFVDGVEEPLRELPQLGRGRLRLLLKPQVVLPQMLHLGLQHGLVLLFLGEGGGNRWSCICRTRSLLPAAVRPLLPFFFFFFTDLLIYFLRREGIWLPALVSAKNRGVGTSNSEYSFLSSHFAPSRKRDSCYTGRWLTTVYTILSLKKGAWEKVQPWTGGQSFPGAQVGISIAADAGLVYHELISS